VAQAVSCLKTQHLKLDKDNLEPFNVNDEVRKALKDAPSIPIYKRQMIENVPKGLCERDGLNAEWIRQKLQYGNSFTEGCFCKEYHLPISYSKKGEEQLPCLPRARALIEHCKEDPNAKWDIVKEDCFCVDGFVPQSELNHMGTSHPCREYSNADMLSNFKKICSKDPNAHWNDQEDGCACNEGCVFEKTSCKCYDEAVDGNDVQQQQEAADTDTTTIEL